MPALGDLMGPLNFSNRRTIQHLQVHSCTVLNLLLSNLTLIYLCPYVGDGDLMSHQNSIKEGAPDGAKDAEPKDLQAIVLQRARDTWEVRYREEDKKRTAALEAVNATIEDAAQRYGIQNTAYIAEIDRALEYEGSKSSVYIVKVSAPSMGSPTFRVQMELGPDGAHPVHISVLSTCQRCGVQYWDPQGWKWAELTAMGGVCEICAHLHPFKEEPEPSRYEDAVRYLGGEL